MKKEAIENDNAGHTTTVTPIAGASTQGPGDLPKSDDHAPLVSRPINGSGRDLAILDALDFGVSPVAILRDHCRVYDRLMRAEKPIGNQIGSHWRAIAKHSGMTAEEVKEKESGVKAGVRALWNIKGVPKQARPNVPGYLDVMMLAADLNVEPIAVILEAHRASVKRFRDIECKIIEEAAMELPVWPWAEGVRGFGALGLGLIVGALGAPMYPDYANPAKVWKRMGLAVLSDGKAQRRVKNAALAIEAGFSPTRRAIMHVAGESLMKQNKEPDGTDGKYRQMYLERKEYEAEKEPDAKKIVWHKRSLRYTEKKFLVDLWVAWKKSC